MKTTQHSSLLVSVFLIIALLLSACGSNNADGNTVSDTTRGTAKEIITIGIPAPLTGDAAMLGTGLRDAVKLAEAELNRRQTKYTYRVVLEDDQLDNAQTVSAFQKMLATDKMDAVIGFSSGSSNAIVPLAEEGKIPMIAIASDPEIVRGKKYAFLHWVTPEEEVRVFAAEAKRRGYQKIAIFSTNQQGMIAVRDQLVAVLGEDMFPVNEVFDPDTKDFRTAIIKAKNVNVDAFMLNFLPGQLIVSAKQVRELGLDQPLTAIEAFEFEEDSYGILEGQWFVTGDDPSNNFVESLQTKYNHAPTLGAANGYDAVHLLAAAFEKAGKNNPNGVVAGLQQLQHFNGALGRLAVGADHRIQSQAAVKVMRDGKPIKVE